jgi:type VI secretion system protein ImpD/type VI secretion system protein ImpC
MADDEDDATIVVRPGRMPAPPAKAPDSPPPLPPLRDAVLAGAFFGAGHAETAARLAGFLANAPPSLSAWFGTEQAAALAADPARLRLWLDRDIAAIDALIGEQLDAILHAPKLQALEGRWRGLSWLVEAIDPSSRARTKILDISWAEICRDLERAAEFDQSQMFRKIYEEEFGSPGGEPYGLLVIDHPIRHRPAPGAPTDDVAAIAALSGVAAAAFAPVVLSAHPSLLQVDRFRDLAVVGDLAAPFRGAEYARWSGLSSREDMRFVAVTLPRLLARVPWGDNPARQDRFCYREYAPDEECRVWFSAGYAFAAVVVRAFVNHAWPGDVRGSDTDRVGGGLVTDLPIESFLTDPPQVWTHPPLDVLLTDAQERALTDAGLMPLSALPFGEQALFGAVRSLQAPNSFIGPNADAAAASARISAQLNSMLCASRFAHYLKVMGREMVGAYRTAYEIEQELQRWLNSYVNASIDGGAEAHARYPLVEARVSIREIPGRPGSFGATVHLQPHFQLDDVAASFRLITEIAAPGARNAA